MANSSLRAITDDRVREFLRLARIAHLGTANRGGEPHNVPLCFWFDGVARFYFAIDEKPKRVTGSGLKRMRNISENPRVALIVDHYEEDWSQLAYVLAHGDANVIDDPTEYMFALRNLRDKYAQYRAMVLNPDRNPIVRIDVDRIHVWGARFHPPAAA